MKKIIMIETKDKKLHKSKKIAKQYICDQVKFKLLTLLHKSKVKHGYSRIDFQIVIDILINNYEDCLIVMKELNDTFETMEQEEEYDY